MTYTTPGVCLDNGNRRSWIRATASPPVGPTNARQKGLGPSDRTRSNADASANWDLVSVAPNTSISTGPKCKVADDNDVIKGSVVQKMGWQLQQWLFLRSSISPPSSSSSDTQKKSCNLHHHRILNGRREAWVASTKKKATGLLFDTLKLIPDDDEMYYCAGNIEKSIDTFKTKYSRDIIFKLPSLVVYRTHHVPCACIPWNLDSRTSFLPVWRYAQKLAYFLMALSRRSL